MQTEPDSIEGLFKKTGEYIETRVELVKYKAIDKSSDIVSSLATSIFITLVILIFIFTATIGIALWIGDMLGKSYYGFFIVSGFYAFAVLILYLCRNSWIKTPVSKLIIEKVIK
jgi:hypothetical protein